jgi:hypothetical protein
MPSKNFLLLVHGLQRALIRATGQFIRENIELVVIVNDEIEGVRQFHKKQTTATRAVASREWDRTVTAFERHCPEADTDLPNPFKASE